MTALPESDSPPAPPAGEVAPLDRTPRGADWPVLAWGDEDVVVDGVRQRRFDVARDGAVAPGLLWTPPSPRTGAGAAPLVLLGHGGAGSKREGYIVSLARRLVRHHGIAAAAIDGPVHGDRRQDPHAPTALVLVEFAQRWANDGEAMTDEMVADWRATLDALESSGEVDTSSVGWWGVSMGTIVGLPVVAAEPRITVAVLGLMGLTGPTRARIESDAPAVTCPLMFLVQWDDAMFPVPDALALWERVGSIDKRLLAHPGGHGALPTDAFDASARFLARHLLEAPAR